MIQDAWIMAEVVPPGNPKGLQALGFSTPDPEILRVDVSLC